MNLSHLESCEQSVSVYFFNSGFTLALTLYIILTYKATKFIQTPGN